MVQFQPSLRKEDIAVVSDAGTISLTIAYVYAAEMDFKTSILTYVWSVV